MGKSPSTINANRETEEKSSCTTTELSPNVERWLTEMERKMDMYRVEMCALENREKKTGKNAGDPLKTGGNYILKIIILKTRNLGNPATRRKPEKGHTQIILTEPTQREEAGKQD